MPPAYLAYFGMRSIMLVLGILVEPAVGPFVISLTAVLIVSAIAYIAQLDVMLRGHLEKKKRK
jgi:hypothetical protein